MPWDDLERDARPLDVVLPGVLARGRRLRRRRQIAVRGVGALAVVICAVGVVTAAAQTQGPDSHRLVRVAGEPPTSVAVEETTTTEVAALPTATTEPTTTTTAAPQSTLTTVGGPGAVAGTVAYHNGQPVPRAKLELSSPGGDRVTFTDDSGRYSFANVSPGEYELLLWSSDAPPNYGPEPPCARPGPCLGHAIAVTSRPITVRRRQTRTEDWVYAYDVSTDTGASSTTSTTTSDTTTTSTTR